MAQPSCCVNTIVCVCWFTVHMCMNWQASDHPTTTPTITTIGLTENPLSYKLSIVSDESNSPEDPEATSKQCIPRPQVQTHVCT